MMQLTRARAMSLTALPRGASASPLILRPRPWPVSAATLGCPSSSVWLPKPDRSGISSLGPRTSGLEPLATRSGPPDGLRAAPAPSLRRKPVVPGGGATDAASHPLPSEAPCEDGPAPEAPALVDRPRGRTGVSKRPDADGCSDGASGIGSSSRSASP